MDRDTENAHCEYCPPGGRLTDCIYNSQKECEEDCKKELGRRWRCFRGSCSGGGAFAFCRECDPKNPFDVTPAGEWNADCKHTSEDECKRNCQWVFQDCFGMMQGDPRGNFGRMSEVSLGETTENSSAYSSLVAGTAARVAPGAFGFMPSGGVKGKCACDSGFEWQKVEHPCGCQVPQSAAQPRASALVDGRALLAATPSLSVVGRRGLASAAPQSECGTTCACCLITLDVQRDEQALRGMFVVGGVPGPGQLVLPAMPGIAVGARANAAGNWSTPFTANIHYDLLLQEGGQPAHCQISWWEAANTANAPLGYPSQPPGPWDPSWRPWMMQPGSVAMPWTPYTWNDARDHPGIRAVVEEFIKHQDEGCVAKDLLRWRTYRAEDKPGRSAAASDPIWNFYFAQQKFLIFIRVESGHAGCLTCCVIIAGDYSTPPAAGGPPNLHNPTLHIGPVQCGRGLDCSPPRMMGKQQFEQLHAQVVANRTSRIQV